MTRETKERNIDIRYEREGNTTAQRSMSVVSDYLLINPYVKPSTAEMLLKDGKFLIAETTNLIT